MCLVKKDVNSNHFSSGGKHLFKKQVLGFESPGYNVLKSEMPAAILED